MNIPDEPHNSDQSAAELGSGGVAPEARRPGALGERPVDPRRWERRALVAVSVLAAALVGTAILFGIQWRHASSTEHDLHAVRQASGTFTQRFLTIDSAHIDRTKKQVVALSTGAFRRTYEQGLQTGLLQAILASGKARTEATVEEVYVGDVDQRSAHVVAQALVTTHSVDQQGKARPSRTTEFYIELDLVKQRGDWLIDQVSNLNFAGPPVTSGSSGSTSTTSTGPTSTGSPPSSTGE